MIYNHFMFLFYFSIILTILSNLLYHIFQKSISPNINPIFSLMVTYLTAFFTSALLLPFFPNSNSFLSSIKELNWASFALALAIIGLEVGFLLAYRSGWGVGLTAIFSNVAVTILLVPIGLLFFKEKINFSNITGVVICILGLILIRK